MLRYKCSTWRKNIHYVGNECKLFWIEFFSWGLNTRRDIEWEPAITHELKDVKSSSTNRIQFMLFIIQFLSQLLKFGNFMHNFYRMILIHICLYFKNIIQKLFGGKITIDMPVFLFELNEGVIWSERAKCPAVETMWHCFQTGKKRWTAERTDWQWAWSLFKLKSFKFTWSRKWFESSNCHGFICAEWKNNLNE